MCVCAYVRNHACAPSARSCLGCACCVTVVRPAILAFCDYECSAGMSVEDVPEVVNINTEKAI